MGEFVLITDQETERFQRLDQDELGDWQFNLMQDLIDTANDIIHREYKDDVILQQGLIMIRLMVLLNMVNRTVVERFSDSEMAEYIRQQYTQSTTSVESLIDDEIAQLKEHFDELKEVLTVDFENEDRRVDGMDTVTRIATLNLREYEDTLNRLFPEPQKV